MFVSQRNIRVCTRGWIVCMRIHLPGSWPGLTMDPNNIIVYGKREQNLRWPNRYIRNDPEQYACRFRSCHISWASLRWNSCWNCISHPSHTQLKVVPWYKLPIPKTRTHANNEKSLPCQRCTKNILKAYSVLLLQLITSHVAHVLGKH